MFSTKHNKRRVRTLSENTFRPDAMLQQINGTRTPTPGPPARLRFSEPLKSTKFKRPMRVLPVKRLFPSRSLTCTLRVKMEWDLKRKERWRDKDKEKQEREKDRTTCQKQKSANQTTHHHQPLTEKIARCTWFLQWLFWRWNVPTHQKFLRGWWLFFRSNYAPPPHDLRRVQCPIGSFYFFPLRPTVLAWCDSARRPPMDQTHGRSCRKIKI